MLNTKFNAFKAVVLTTELMIAPLTATAGSGFVKVNLESVGSTSGPKGYYSIVIDQVINPEDCPKAVKEVWWDPANKEADGMMSVAITALTTDMPIYVYVYGCLEGVPQADSMRLAKKQTVSSRKSNKSILGRTPSY